MDIDEEKNIRIIELKKIKKSFEESIKILEKHVAQSIIDSQKLQEVRKDLREANKKFNDAEKCLDNLKIDLNKKKLTPDNNF